MEGELSSTTEDVRDRPGDQIPLSRITLMGGAVSLAGGFVADSLAGTLKDRDEDKTALCDYQQSDMFHTRSNADRGATLAGNDGAQGSSDD